MELPSVDQTAILYPIFALAAWTFGVLSVLPVVRIRAARRGEVRASDFRLGESAAVPESVRLPNRNYMNLLELPVLFYVVCLMLYMVRGVTPTALVLAWIYVALRVLHSMIHLGYNNVLHRLAAFAVSNVVLIVLWVVAAMHVHHMA